jgi:hypothetical protein
MVRPVDVDVRGARGARLMPTRVLARVATTGIYLVRGVPRELQRAARLRAVSEGTSLRWVLLQGLREYAAGTWTPHRDDKSAESARDQMPLTTRAGAAGVTPVSDSDTERA